MPTNIPSNDMKGKNYSTFYIDYQPISLICTTVWKRFHYKGGGWSDFIKIPTDNYYDIGSDFVQNNVSN